MSAFDRDEIIADSEEEMDYVGSYPAPTTKASTVSDFTASVGHGIPSDEIGSYSTMDRQNTWQKTRETKEKSVIEDRLIDLSVTSPKTMAVENPLLLSEQNSGQVHKRPRPRPRPIFKGARTKLDSAAPSPHPYPFARDPVRSTDISAIQPLTSSPAASGLPIATSPAFSADTTSQLPPSDFLPPIEILQSEPYDEDKRLSSPGSFVTEPMAKRKQRKRKVAVDIPEGEPEVDQLMPTPPCRPGASSHTGPSVFGAYTRTPDEPPPTFFAGSSSLGRNDEQSNPQSPSKLQAEVIDLTDLPPTAHNTKAGRGSKMKKNSAMEIDQTIEQCGDGDSDFRPGVKPKKKERKGKESVKEKENKKENKPKGKKENSRKKKGQQDGVLQSGDKSGKTKTAKPPETFKSREIICDSDEEIDPLLLVESKATAGMCTPEKDGLDLDQTALSSESGVTKSLKSKVSTTALVASKRKGQRKGRKRKSILESDEEGSEDGEHGQERECIVVKRRKSSTPDPSTKSDEAADSTSMRRDEAVRKSVPCATSKSGNHLSPRVSDDLKTIGNDSDARQDESNSPAKNNERTNAEKISVPANHSAVKSRPIPNQGSSTNSTPLYSRYEVAPRRSSLSMSELIRRANSKPGSPFPTASCSTPSEKHQGKGKRPSFETDTPLKLSYSPYLRTSRRALSKIAPLHLSRKTPPPAPPPPPQKKKTKKELEMEEKWEEELVESVGGIDIWAAMSDSERREMRRSKREMEMGGYD